MPSDDNKKSLDEFDISLNRQRPELASMVPSNQEAYQRVLAHKIQLCHFPSLVLI